MYKLENDILPGAFNDYTLKNQITITEQGILPEKILNKQESLKIEINPF